MCYIASRSLRENKIGRRDRNFILFLFVCVDFESERSGVVCDSGGGGDDNDDNTNNMLIGRYI
jgi:hypothetical protein